MGLHLIGDGKRPAMKKTRSALVMTVALVVAGCSSAPDADTGASGTVLPASTTSTALTTTVVESSVTTTTRASDPADGVAVTTSPPPGQVATVEVLVYLLGGPDADPDGFDCAAVSPVVRNVHPPALLRGAFEALLAGPTDEEREAGYDSWFSSDTGWSLGSVTIVDGVARIDFSEDSPLINNASTSCGSAGFLAQLDSTALQFPTVEEVVYSFGGDPAPFYEWLQRDPPEA